MGYALFTARKLSLTTRLNQSNAQLMSNSERANSLTVSIYAKQSASALDKATKSQEAYKEYSSAIQGADETAKSEAQAVLNEALAEIDTQSAMTDAEIQQLNMQQTCLDQERERLQTQLNSYQNELESVEKAEEEAIKNAAPKF